MQQQAGIKDSCSSQAVQAEFSGMDFLQINAVIPALLQGPMSCAKSAWPQPKNRLRCNVVACRVSVQRPSNS